MQQKKKHVPPIASMTGNPSKTVEVHQPYQRDSKAMTDNDPDWSFYEEINQLYSCLNQEL